MDRETAKQLEQMLAQPANPLLKRINELEQEVAVLQQLYGDRTILLAQAVIHANGGLMQWKLPLSVQARLPSMYQLVVEPRPDEGYTLLRIIEPKMVVPAVGGDAVGGGDGA